MAKSWARKLRRKTGRGLRGYPVGTVAFYGPTDERAIKVVAGVVESEGEAKILRKWFSEELDVRVDPEIGRRAGSWRRGSGRTCPGGGFPTGSPTRGAPTEPGPGFRCRVVLLSGAGVSGPIATVALREW